ncbi:hypothetical protein FACS189431_3890 [Alphaproteobacteria bacterium]|nr:hypothetical protein FACS189431_3890 [Alphaproteobacteria bacterium]
MIHFYYGANDFAIRRQISSLTAQFAKKYGVENVVRLESSQADADKLLSEIVNIGLFSPNRLIIIDDVFGNKDLVSKLADGLSRVPDETNLVLVSAKPDKRTKLYKELVKITKPREFAQLKPFEIDKFVVEEAAAQHVETKPDGIKELVVYTGGDMWRIASEIAKFQALGKVVTAARVRELVEPDLSASAFNLLDDLLNGRRDQALRELAKLRRTEDANKFLGLLSSQVFALTAAVNAGEKPSGAVAGEMGVHPFVMSKMFDVARKMSPRDVARIAQIVAETDAKTKSTGADSWILIELVINKV